MICEINLSAWISAGGTVAAAIAAWFAYTVSKESHEFQKSLKAEDSPQLKVWWELRSQDPHHAVLTFANIGKRTFIANTVVFLTSNGGRLLATYISPSTSGLGYADKLQDFKVEPLQTVKIDIKSEPQGAVYASISQFDIRIQYYSGRFAPTVTVDQGWLGPYPIENDVPKS